MKTLYGVLALYSRKIKSVLVIFVFLLSISCNQKQTREVESTPIEKLAKGNSRFVSGYPVHPDETIERIRELKDEQNPFAIIVSCSDSRVPPELVFDQGLGDLFVIRTAGNVIGDYELGSIEYAIEHLHCKLIVVLGHENCGAIEAFINSGGSVRHDHIGDIIEYLKNEPEEKELLDSMKNSYYAVRANVLHGMHLLKTSNPVLSPLFQKKEFDILGAVYDLDNGKVEMIDDKTN